MYDLAITPVYGNVYLHIENVKHNKLCYVATCVHYVQPVTLKVQYAHFIYIWKAKQIYMHIYIYIFIFIFMYIQLHNLLCIHMLL